MSHADDLFDEADKAERELERSYNPKLSLSQLLAPTPDTKLATMSDDNLVRCEATVVIGETTTKFRYLSMLKSAELPNQVFVSGPCLTTRCVEVVPLTVEEARVARRVLGE